MPLNIKVSYLTRGFLVFILLSVIVMVVILFWTTKSATWQQLARFQWEFIPVLLAFGTLRWYTDGMAFVTMAKHGSKSSVGINRAASIRLQGNLVGSVVPVLVGNFSMHAYLLHKEKLKIHESMAITVLRAVLPVFIFLVNIPILFFMKGNPESVKFFDALVKAISLPIVGIVVFMVITLFYPNRIKRVALAVVHWLGRIKMLRKDRLFAVQKKLFREINQFSSIFWSYLQGRKLMMLGALGWLVITFALDYLIAMAILWGFGYAPPFWKAMAFQNLIRPIIFFALTPGGAGVSEFTYLGFFSLYMPKHLIGIPVLIWRLVLTYLPAVVASFLLIHEFREDTKLKDMLLEKGHLPEDKLENDKEKN